MDERKRSRLPRIGIFGTGWTARMLIPIFTENGFLVTAICGRKQESAERLGNDLNITFRTSSFQEFLLKSEVDLVCIVSPPHTHAEMAVKALSAGKHVLCSFPMALTKSEAEKMVTSARYYPSLLALCPNPLRHLPAIVKMKSMLDEGFCGKLMVCEVVVRRGPLVHPKGYTWMCDGTMGGGLLSTVGSFVIDTLMYLTSERIQEVSGQVRTLVTQQPGKVEGFRSINSDDFASFTLSCESGLHATVILNSHVPHQYTQEMMVIGNQGRLTVRGSDLYAQASGETEERLILRGDDVASGQEDLPDGGMAMPSLLVRGTEQAIADLSRAFDASSVRMQADRGLIASCATFEDGLYVNAAVDAIHDSSNSGRCQHVTIDKEGQRNPFWTSNGGDSDRTSPKPNRSTVS